MPSITIVYYKDEAGNAPLLEWLHLLPKRAKAKCIAKMERLRSEGVALRRPEADYLRDGIFELRVGLHGINYRLLYFFPAGSVSFYPMASSRSVSYRTKR